MQGNVVKLTMRLAGYAGGSLLASELVARPMFAVFAAAEVGLRAAISRSVGPEAFSFTFQMVARAPFTLQSG